MRVPLPAASTTQASALTGAAPCRRHAKPLDSQHVPHRFSIMFVGIDRWPDESRSSYHGQHGARRALSMRSPCRTIRAHARACGRGAARFRRDARRFRARSHRGAQPAAAGDGPRAGSLRAIPPACGRGGQAPAAGRARRAGAAAARGRSAALPDRKADRLLLRDRDRHGAALPLGGGDARRAAPGGRRARRLHQQEGRLHAPASGPSPHRSPCRGGARGRHGGRDKARSRPSARGARGPWHPGPRARSWSATARPTSIRRGARASP